MVHGRTYVCPTVQYSSSIELQQAVKYDQYSARFILTDVDSLQEIDRMSLVNEKIAILVTMFVVTVCFGVIPRKLVQGQTSVTMNNLVRIRYTSGVTQLERTCMLLLSPCR